MAVWFDGRNTSAIVRASDRAEAISKARFKKVTGSTGKVKSVKKLSGKALKDANAGRWVRIRANQPMNASKPVGGSFRFRKGLAKKATNVLSPSQRQKIGGK